MEVDNDKNLYGLFYNLDIIQYYQREYENNEFTTKELLEIMDEADFKFYKKYGWRAHFTPKGFTVYEFCRKNNLPCKFKDKGKLRVELAFYKPDEDKVVKDALENEHVLDNY